MEDGYFKIYLKNRKGDIYIAKVDVEDFLKIKNFKYTWSADYKKSVDNYYAVATEYLGYINGKPKYQSVYMHRYILEITNKKIIVDHKNHDTLDNRKDNLRITNNNNNTKHKKGKNKNNTSGYRNVTRGGKWWIVQLQIDGVNTCLKKFPLKELDKAGAYAERMRNKIYGEFAGEN